MTPTSDRATAERALVGVKACIFDMDGVLVDSERPALDLLGELLRGEGVDLEPGVLRQVCGRPAGYLRTFLTTYLGDGDALEAFSTRYEAGKRHLVASGAIRPFPGTVEVLSLLRCRGLRLAIATSTTAGLAHARLAQNDLERRFDHVVTGDLVARGKPAPDIFVLAAERLGVSTAACMVVEDSPVGVRAGRSAGMTVIALATTFPLAELTAADRVLGDMAELRGFLEEAVPAWSGG